MASHYSLLFLTLFRRLTMNKRQALIAAALATVITATASTAFAEPAKAGADKEQCFDIAKAGQNDCASPNGAHACGDQSKVDNGGGEWKFVAKGTWEKAGGKVVAK